MKNIPVACLIVASSAGIANADPSRCAQSQSDLSYFVADIPELNADTGWFPSGSPVQAKVVGHLAGTTSVAMSLQPTACWNAEGMSITPDGVSGGGMLQSGYGADLHVYGHFHASIIGHSIDWTGEIPLPSYVPSDLFLDASTPFDPTALPGSSQPNVSATSTPTSPVTVLSTNVLGSLIGITGISGDLSVTAQAELTTSYHTSSITIGGATITDASGAAPVLAPAEGYAGVLAKPISAAGVVSYNPSLVLAAHADVKLFGITIGNWTIASVTLPLPHIDRNVTLDGGALAFALPYLDSVPTTLGFASGATQSLQLHNAGGAPLVVEVQSAPMGVTATSITIAAGDTGQLQVNAADPTAVGGESLVLATNDPDHPQLTIALDPSSSGGGSGSGGGGDGDGGHASSGCNAGGAQGSGLAVIALGLVLARRRRRAC